MSASPETLYRPLENPEQLPAGVQPLTPDQLAMLQLQGIDPASPEAQALLAGSEYGMTPGDTAERHDPVAEAEDILARAERRALDETPQPEGTDAAAVVEQAQQEQRVSDARKQVEQAFGTEVVEHAIERAIDDSHLATRNGHEIAEATAHSKSVLPSAEKELDTGEAAITDAEVAKAKYAELKDRADGDADRIVGRVAEKAQHRLRRFGISKRKKELAAEAVEANGKQITTTEKSLETEQEEVGEAVIGSLVDNKPSMSHGRRKQLLEELKDDPQAMKVVGEAARSYRHYGNRKLRAYRRVGKALSKYH